jgi:hypothetical protein
MKPPSLTSRFLTSHSLLVLALLCAVCGAACKKSPSALRSSIPPADTQPVDSSTLPTDTPPADTPPADMPPSSTPPADTPPAAALPGVVAELKEVELSVFENNKAGCVWKRIRFPGAQAKTVAQFSSACSSDTERIKMAWSPDFTRAAVIFSLQKAFEVEVATGKLRPFPTTQKLRGEVMPYRMEFGVSAEGTVVMSTELLEESFVQKLRRKEAKEFKFTWEGKAFSIKAPEDYFEPGYLPEGEPLFLAHAWLLKEGAWTLIESQFTFNTWPYPIDLRSFELFEQLGIMGHSTYPIEPRFFPGRRRLAEAGEAVSPQGQILKAPKAPKLLAEWTPEVDESEEDDGWAQISTPYGELFVWIHMDDYNYIFDILYQPKGKPVAPLPALGSGPQISAELQDKWLIAQRFTRKYHLYDLKRGALVWSSNSPSVAFWPSKGK